MQLKRTIGEFPESYFAIWKSISADHSTALFFAFGFASLTFIRKEGCKELENKEFMGRRRLETVKGEKVTYEKCQDWNLMFQCTIVFNSSTFLSFQVFPFSWFPAAPFFNVNKNLGKPILEILLIFLHSFMVNQNEKWWHIQLFLFCWITSFFLSDRN